MQTFQFQITQGYVKTILEKPIDIQPEYVVDNDKVILMNLDIPPYLFPLIINNYALHSNIHVAAELDYLTNVKPYLNGGNDVLSRLGGILNPQTAQI